MDSPGRLLVLLGCLTACATSDDPESSSDTDPTVTASFTSTGDTGDTLPPPDTSDTNDTNDTTPPPDDTTGGGSTDTGGTSTGGCVPGEEGCDCLAEDPACGEGLLCIEEVCAVPQCPADLDEPNDLQGETIHIIDINDGTAPQTHMGTLSGTDDVDWWSYYCNDALLSGLNPVQSLTAATGARFCTFLDCEIGGNPLLPEGCPAGTTDAISPLDSMPGCCSTDGLPTEIEYNCPDSSDDSLTIYFRVDMPAEDVCVDYTIDFEC